MGRYDAHKNPFMYRINQWVNRRTTNETESFAKSIPCHIVQIEKDFVHVAFETANSIFTMPVVKIPQSFSGYGREPTQVKDMGLAVPGNYYLGGVSGFAGGNTNFYPRGNLTTLSFQPNSNLNAPKRDYNQHTVTGGPTGWIAKVMNQAGLQESQQSGTSTGTSAQTVSRAHRQVMQRRNFLTASGLKVKDVSTPTNGSSSSSSSNQSSQQQDLTQFQFDQNGLCTIQSKDTTYNITVDNKNKKATINVPVGAYAYIGGDGKTGSYAPLVTTKGPVITAQGRYA
jgi:hypothetical protein